MYSRIPNILSRIFISQPLISSLSKFGQIFERCHHHRVNCLKTDGPRCSKEELAKTECGINLARKKAGLKYKKPYPFIHLFQTKECCNNPCPYIVPRFDDLYYKESDKSKRKYVRTWKNCVTPMAKKKAMCSFENLPPLPYKKRKFADKPKTACPLPMDCTKLDKKCTKIVLPGCKAVRISNFCFQSRRPSDCKKVCTQYPAFSECIKPEPKKRRPVECNCVKGASICDLYAYLERKIKSSRKNK